MFWSRFWLMRRVGSSPTSPEVGTALMRLDGAQLVRTEEEIRDVLEQILVDAARG